MAELMEDTLLLQNGSSESRVQVKKIQLKHINEFPTELLSKVLGYLPQKDLVRNRGVCKHWRDVIDEHCPMHHVKLRRDDKFLERKMQLRIRTCHIMYLDEGSRISFSYPQYMRTFTFSWHIPNIEIIRHLLNQVKPYVHCLTLQTDFEENILSPPYQFPQVRELRILGVAFIDVLFAHRIPLLTKLDFRVDFREWQKMDETYTHFLNFLGNHAETMKHLELNISNNYHDVEPQELFRLPNGFKRLLSKGRLQFQFLEVQFPYRYSSIWGQIINSQRDLTDLKVTLRGCHDKGGVTFHTILSAVSSNISTLRSINLWNIPLFPSDDETSLVPFDCSVFRDAVNLRELRLYKNLYYTKGAEMTNLGEIPLGSLKVLVIAGFICNSGELQSLVDEAEMLEDLHLNSTMAPSNSPKFACTGVHGGIIQSFLDKPNKKHILVDGPMNFSSKVENEKYEAIKLLYPNLDRKICVDAYFDF